MEVTKKWLATMQVCASDYLAYRLNFLLEFLGPALIFYFIKYNIWSAIYTTGNHSSLRGYSLPEMLSYQSWILAVILLSQTYRGVELALDIRHGRISSFLLYPFRLWQYHASRCLTFFLIQSVIVAVTISVLAIIGLIPMPDLSNCARAYFLAFMVACFWFGFIYISGLMAFWLEETWVFRVAMIMLTEFLSGSLIPLEFFPEWLRQGLFYTPFPYLAYYPVQVVMGRVESVSQAALSLGIWTVIIGLLATCIWKRGLRLYTAAGM